MAKVRTRARMPGHNKLENGEKNLGKIVGTRRLSDYSTKKSFLFLLARDTHTRPFYFSYIF